MQLSAGSTLKTPIMTFALLPGRISGYLPPGGPGVRIDSHVYTDYQIPPYYDSLIGKLIVWAPDRPTEPFLIPLRKIVQPIGGVDITPIIWVGIFSLVREILLGQQGLLTMLSRVN